MVLLNGVKYACERCIRGHRVSSCTHTDKPLTMIKPKGRPASQCPHCREQRKLKNTHSSCNCGKKGKPPGTHLASCLCHKNSHCTCPSKEKKSSVKKKTETSPSSGSEHTPFSATGSTGGADGLAPVPQHLNGQNQLDYLYDDFNSQFESEQGLLDYLVELEVLGGNQGVSGLHGTQGLPSATDDSRPNSSLDSVTLLQETRPPAAPFLGLSLMTNSPSDAELDAMENMFPLFPLVGSSSFDDDKSLPLLPIPDKLHDQRLKTHVHNQAHNHSPQGHNQTQQMAHNQLAHNQLAHNQANQIHNQAIQAHNQTLQAHNSHQTPTQTAQPQFHHQNSYQNLHAHTPNNQTHTPQGLGFTPVSPAHAPPLILSNSAGTNGPPPPVTAPPRVSLQLHITSSPSFNSLHNAATYHPHPMKPSTSFTIGATNLKPRRPESVLSVASTLSNTSKQNLVETPQMTQHVFQKTNSSAAFPPFLLSINNSTDDFSFPQNYSLSAVHNEALLMMFLSDEEHTQMRVGSTMNNQSNGHGNGYSIHNGPGGGHNGPPNNGPGSNFSLGNGPASGSITSDQHIPLRQPQPLRRTSSLSRSYTQIQPNVNTLKDHLPHLSTLKIGPPVDGSPRLGSVGVPGSATERSFFKPLSLGSLVPEEDEELQMAIMSDTVLQGGYVSDAHVLKNDFDIDNSMPTDFQDFKSIPMYQDLFEGMEK